MSIESSAKLITVAEPFVIVPDACLKRCGRLAGRIVGAASPISELHGITMDKEPRIEVVACSASAAKAILPFVCSAHVYDAGIITAEGTHIGSILREKYLKVDNGNTIIQDATDAGDPVLTATEAIAAIRAHSRY